MTFSQEGNIVKVVNLGLYRFMIENYLTGLGFLGKHLVKKLGKVTSIPHDKIATAKLEPFTNFFYLSTYGNLIEHDDGRESTAKVVKANVLDLCHILDEAIQYKFKSFVFISTSSVKLQVQTTYSRTKKAAEEILLAYREKYRLPILIIRPYTIIGVGEPKQHLIPTLIRSCITGEKMNFVKEPRHDYIDVEDVVDGILNLSEHSNGGIYELGSGKSVSNQEVLELVEKVTGKKANITIVPNMRSYDTQQWVSTNFRARSFGWLPTKSLQVSIEEMVKEYEKQR